MYDSEQIAADAARRGEDHPEDRIGGDGAVGRRAAPADDVDGGLGGEVVR